MKSKIVIALLLIVSLVLGGVLIFHNRKAQDRVVKDTQIITTLSNNWTQTSVDLEEQLKVNQKLASEVTDRNTQISSLSTTLSEEKAARAKAEVEAQRAAQAAAAEIAKKDAQIAEKEVQLTQQTKQLEDLNTEITSLEKKIADTEKELATTQGDKEFLLKELKRLQTEKARLEDQFQNLALLRDQVRKLKDQLALARRLEWIRMGSYGPQTSGKGGAGKLMNGFTQEKPLLPPSDLKVELDTQGGAQVVAPAGTNAPTPPK